jgi:hypothetical protein
MQMMPSTTAITLAVIATAPRWRTDALRMSRKLPLVPDWSGATVPLCAPAKRPERCPAPNADLVSTMKLNERQGRASLIGAAELEIGQRIKMSAIGTARSPRLALKLGVVVGLSRYNNSITVLFDGNKTSTCLHRDYIEPM